MTALCGGGTSSPIPGVADTVYGGAAISAYLSTKGIPYLAEVALALSVVAIVMNDF